MERSVLLQLARDSIQEVIEAQNSINKNTLLEQYPLLNEKIAVELTLIFDNEIRGNYTTQDAHNLLTNIIIAAKKAAFEDKNFSPITTAEYLHSHIKLSLFTPDGVISEIDPPLIQENNVETFI